METLTTLDRAIRLQKVDLFAELETDLLALLASIAKQIPYARGEVLFNEHAPASALYVVLAGRIQMSRGGQAMFTVGPDDTIGNWALFDEQPSVVTASAEEDSWLLLIEQQDFFDLLADHSEITPKMFRLFRVFSGWPTGSRLLHPADPTSPAVTSEPKRRPRNHQIHYTPVRSWATRKGNKTLINRELSL